MHHGKHSPAQCKIPCHSHFAYTQNKMTCKATNTTNMHDIGTGKSWHCHISANMQQSCQAHLFPSLNIQHFLTLLTLFSKSFSYFPRFPTRFLQDFYRIPRGFLQDFYRISTGILQDSVRAEASSVRAGSLGARHWDTFSPSSRRKVSKQNQSKSVPKTCQNQATKQHTQAKINQQCKQKQAKSRQNKQKTINKQAKTSK